VTTPSPATTINFDEVERLMLRQRAIRLFTAQDVDDGLIERAIRAATRAPSGGNSQPWRFIVIRERETKAALGRVFDELGRQLYGDHAPEHTPWEQVPALIAVCARAAAVSIPGGGGSSVFPAVQNLLLALQGLGLGSVLTTRWKIREAETRPLLGLPEDMEVHAILPVGWPAKRYGRGTRKPVEDVTYREKFGQPWR
jgi:nitroreductase